MNQCPIPLWAVPLTDRGNGWYQDILPVAKKGLLKEQHKSSDHGSNSLDRRNQGTCTRRMEYKATCKSSPRGSVGKEL